MAFNTGNPVGSRSPKDLLDNSENLDELVNSPTKESHPDRLGVDRKTWHGMESEFDADQAARQSEFDADQADRESEWLATLAGAGYVGTGSGGAFEDYDADGPLTIDAFNEIFTRSGELYRAKPGTALPYDTTGTWATDEVNFVAVGDAALRSELAGPGGGRLIRDAVSKVASVPELLDITAPLAGQVVEIADGGKGGGVRWNGASLTNEVANDPDQNKYIPPTADLTGASGAWERIPESDHPLVVLASGQSNMRGIGGGGPRKVRKNVQVWNPASGGAFETLDLENVISMPSGNALGGTGPFGPRNNIAAAFCHRLYEETGRDVYLIIDARGGTAIEEGWLDAPNLVYDNMKPAVEDALAAIGRDKIDIMLWHQGEADRFVANPDDHYKNLRTLLAKLSAETWFDGGTPFIAGELSPAQTNDNGGVALRFLNVDGRFNTSCASSLGLSTETDGHIDGPSLWEFGYNRYWDNYKKQLGFVTRGIRPEVHDYYTRADASTGMAKVADWDAGLKIYPLPSAQNNYRDTSLYPVFIEPARNNKTFFRVPKGDADLDLSGGVEWNYFGDNVTQIPTYKINAERFLLGADGYLDAPGTPAFEASIAANITGYASNAQIIFDDELLDNGGNYDDVGSDFTNPQAGIYLITLTVKLVAAATVDHYFRVTRNNAQELGVAFIPSGEMIGTVTFRASVPTGGTLQVYSLSGYGTDDIDATGHVTRFAAHRIS